MRLLIKTPTYQKVLFRGAFSLPEWAAFNRYFSRLSRIHLIPEPIIIYLSRSSSFGKLVCNGQSGIDVVRGILNLSALLSAVIFFSSISMSLGDSILTFLSPVLFALILIFMYPMLHLKRLAVSELKTSLFVLDLFSSVYLLTGSIETSASYLAEDCNLVTARRFREVLLRIRNGTEPRKALIKTFSRNRALLEWIKSLTFGSYAGTSSLMESWKAEAMKNLSRSEDLMALIILVSTLLPIVMTIVFLVCGVGSSPLIFTLVVIVGVEFLCLHIWMKELIYTID